MSERAPMSDLVVLVPGIMGSALAIEGREVWGLSGRAIMRGVLSLGASVDRLKLPREFRSALPEGPGDGEPADGVDATRLMPDLHAIPGLWCPIKGYTSLTRMFLDRFAITGAAERPANFIEFPYDWRLSNVVSARRLAAMAIPALERWRTQVPDAKLVLVCHSMGGLVARWFLEMLGGAELTRWLITIATPYRGAVNALETLVNGLSKGLGPLKMDLTSLVRNFPALYELLPTYPCLDVGGGELKDLSDVPIGLDPEMLRAAVQFHERLAKRIGSRTSAPYGIVAIKGIHQPTAQSALLQSDGSIHPTRVYKGLDRGGDGTVPRPSSHPPEWTDESRGHTVFAAQRHATIQETESVLAQLFGTLTGRFGTFLGGQPIGLELPDLIQAGEPLEIAVTAEDSTLALSATVSPHDNSAVVASAELLENLGGGRYRTRFDNLAPGTYQVTVASASPAVPVDPVSDITIVWQPDAV